MRRRGFRVAFRIPFRAPRAEQVAREVDEELAFHLAMRAEQLGARGMSPAEARAEALRQFGPTEHVRAACVTLDQERVKAMHRATFVENALQGAVNAGRSLRRQGRFAAAIVLTMMLGIGANVAVFSVAYGVLLRPLPYADSDALVRLWSRNDARQVEFFSVSPADYAVWRERGRSFAAMAAFERQRALTLLRGNEPQLVDAARLSPDVFALLGTRPLLGRALVPSDAQPGAPAVAVLEHDLWATQFGSDAGVVGTSLVLEGEKVTVVGVMPPRFAIPGSASQVWTPLSLADASTDHSNRYLRVLGRLRPGATVDGARRELDDAAAGLAREFDATNRGWAVNVVSLPEWIIGREWRQAVLVLSGVVGCVLLIACANAANLQLARGAARRKEIALRAALGADRGRIVAQLLAESLALALAGGAAGLALAAVAVRVLRSAGTDVLPRLDEVGIHPVVLAFALAASVAGGLLFGILPALGASRADAGAMLRDGGRDGQSTVGRRTRAALVVGQVALSLVLLVGAGLLMRSFARLQAVDLGFAPGDVQLATVVLPNARYPEPAQQVALQGQLLERVRRTPGVRSAALVSSAPFYGPNNGITFSIPGRPLDPGAPAPDADARDVSDGYFRTLRIGLVRGRDFTPADRGARVVVVSEALARRYWPNADPIGREVALTAEDDARFTVIGVVRDVRYQTLDTPEVRPMLYFAALGGPSRALTVAADYDGELARPLRQIVRDLDPQLPVPTVDALGTLVERALATQRFSLLLFALFAATALLLAAIGIYGMLSYLVRQRTRELGLRVALGASSRTLVRSVVGGALAVVVPGVLLGLVGSWMLTRLIASLLFGVSPTDVATFAGVSALLIATAVLASVLPARRAGKADPMLVLRGEVP